MKADWVKYCEIYVDAKFNHKVVCMGCDTAAFMDMKAYWEHVEAKHWRKYDSNRSHTDFQRATLKTAMKDVSGDVIDLTALSDDEGESFVAEVKKEATIKRSGAVKTEKDFDELEAQLSRIHGEFVMANTQEMQEAIYGEESISTQELQEELLTPCISIPTPEASPVENQMSWPFPAAAKNQVSTVEKLPKTLTYAQHRIKQLEKLATSVTQQSRQYTNFSTTTSTSNQSGQYAGSAYNSVRFADPRPEPASSSTFAWYQQQTRNPISIYPITTSHQQQQVQVVNSSITVPRVATSTAMSLQQQQHLQTSTPITSRQRRASRANRNVWQQLPQQPPPSRRQSCNLSNFRCEICPQKPAFKTAENFEQHRLRFHSGGNSSRETFYCDVCDRFYMNWCSKKHDQTFSHKQKLEKRNCNPSGGSARIVRRRKTIAFSPY